MNIEDFAAVLRGSKSKVLVRTAGLRDQLNVFALNGTMEEVVPANKAEGQAYLVMRIETENTGVAEYLDCSSALLQTGVRVRVFLADILEVHYQQKK